jgi:hypothetical protein
MLTKTSFDTDHVWNKLQEPARPAGRPADYLLLLSALDEGWKILEAARLVPFNDFLHGGSYILTIFHPIRLVIRQIVVTPTPELDALLKDDDDVTIVNRSGIPEVG